MTGRLLIQVALGKKNGWTGGMTGVPCRPVTARPAPALWRTTRHPRRIFPGACDSRVPNRDRNDL